MTTTQPSLTDEQNELVRRGAALVETIVAGFVPRFPRCDREDLAAHGYLGLVEAAKRFDAVFGTPFQTYARPRIRGAIVDHLRRELPYLDGLGAANRAASDYIGGPHDPVDPFAADEAAEERLAQMSEGLATSLFAAYTTSASFGGESAAAERQMVERATAALEASVEELPERDRAFVRRRFFDGLDLTAVADELQLPYRSAKRLNVTVIDKLARAMKRRGVAVPV